MHQFWKKLNLTKKTSLILVGIVLLGFIFRAYNFSEWLRFNMDQSRDIALVENAISTHSWPLFGPKAGGTDFRLGPAFYYFQIISAKIFGASPASVAFPDLLFSLLSIPLFFLLARIYFNKSISLSLTWLFAISYFVIKYSRFAWNPNSTPFFVMLFIYSVYRISNTEKYEKIWWTILAGLSMGIGMQLHTTLLIIMPVAALFFAYYLFKNKTLTVAVASVMLASILLINVGQIISEVKTGGLNTLAFFLSSTTKNSRNTNFLDNLALNATCHIRANFGIVASYAQEEDCGYADVARDAKKLDGNRMPLADKIRLVLYMLGATIFSLGGYYLLFREMRKEADGKKRLFLKLALSYIILTFLFFTIWATELSMRFFLILEFVPFLLLGFWLKFLTEKNKKLLLIAVVTIFSFFSLYKDYSVFRDLQFGGREINGNFEYITLGEAKFVVDYIGRNNAGEKTSYLDAQAGYLFKSLRSLQFIAKKTNLEIVELTKAVNLEGGARLFYIRSASDSCRLPENALAKYEVEKCATYRQFSVFALKVK
ncbi:MAG: glycosyltransferase family 39 protein [Candidatus Moraniibacteriota bacterium]